MLINCVVLINRALNGRALVLHSKHIGDVLDTSHLGEKFNFSVSVCVCIDGTPETERAEHPGASSAVISQM